MKEPMSREDINQFRQHKKVVKFTCNNQYYFMAVRNADGSRTSVTAKSRKALLKYL